MAELHPNIKMAMDWSTQYPDEWEIVIGVRMATLKRNFEVQKMLSDAGLEELEEMMANRTMYLICDEEEAAYHRKNSPQTN